MKLSVIGLGYVGLPLASLLAHDYEVIGFDVEPDKINKIKRGESPINEPGLEQKLREALDSGMLEITDDPNMLKESSVKIVTVGTPFDEKKDFVDYSQLESSLEIIVPHINRGDIILLKSTVPPGTTMGFVKNRIESAGFNVPKDVGLVFSPERMIEGQAIRDFNTLPKIIGASDQRSQNVAEEILGKLGGKIIRVSNPETAETIKMVDNYSRYVFLGLTNELALACERIGVDVLEVIRSAKDNYPRNSGLLIPGPGVGGSCLNKDPFILRGVLRNSGMELEMVKSAQIINSSMPFHVVDIVKKYRKAGTVSLLGVAFKGDTDDTRFTPSFTIRDDLRKNGYNVRVADPYVKGSGIFSDPYESCKGSDIVVILTDHTQYKNIDCLKLKSSMAANPLMIDARGIVDRNSAMKLGFEYHGVGRL